MLYTQFSGVIITIIKGSLKMSIIGALNSPKNVNDMREKPKGLTRQMSL